MLQLEQSDLQRRELMIRALRDRSAVYQFVGKYKLVKEDCCMIKELAQSPQHEILYYWGIHFMYERTGEFKNALAILEIGIRIAQKKKLYRAEVEMVSAKVHLLARQGKSAEALRLAHMNIRRIERLKGKIGDRAEILTREAELLNNIGIIYLSMENYKQALFFFNQSKEIRSKQENAVNLSVALNNIALVYWKTGDYEKALKFNLDALEMRRKAGHAYGICSSLNNIGLIHDEMGNFEKALQFYKMAFTDFERLNDLYGMTIALSNIGSIYLDVVGDLLKALECYRQCLAIVKKTGDTYGEAESLISLGFVCLKKRSYRDLKYCLDAISPLVGKLASEELGLHHMILKLEWQLASGKMKKPRMGFAALQRVLVSSKNTFVVYQAFSALMEIFYKYDFKSLCRKLSGKVAEMARGLYTVKSPLRRANILRALVKFYIMTKDHDRAGENIKLLQGIVDKYKIRVYEQDIKELGRKINAGKLAKLV